MLSKNWAQKKSAQKALFRSRNNLWKVRTSPLASARGYKPLLFAPSLDIKTAQDIPEIQT